MKFYWGTTRVIAFGLLCALAVSLIRITYNQIIPKIVMRETNCIFFHWLEIAFQVIPVVVFSQYMACSKGKRQTSYVTIEENVDRPHTASDMTDVLYHSLL